MGDPESAELVAVHVDDLYRLQMLKPMLESYGHQVFIENEHVKTLAPVETGGSIFAARLMAPRAEAADIRDTIRALENPSKESPSAGQPEEEDSPFADEEEREQLRRMGIRIRFAAILVVTSPIGIWWGLRYIAGVFRCERLPSGNSLNVGAIFLCIINTLIMLWSVLA